jgi:hypothetical protein
MLTIILGEEGVLSGLPIILYTLFLTAFTASVLTTFLVIPIKSILLFLIPVIVVLNGFASLAGVTYTSPLKSPIPDPDPDPTVLAIGFTSDFAFRVSEVLTTSALFPLIFFQALCAFFCFYPAKNPDGHLEIGIVLGAVETLIGLGNTGLNNLILRRGMRFLARTFIFAGLLRMYVFYFTFFPFQPCTYGCEKASEREWDRSLLNNRFPR